MKVLVTGSTGHLGEGLMASVFHDPDAAKASEDEAYNTYVEYGRRLMKMLDGLGVVPMPYVS